jgi:hypothetical protein
MGDPRHRGVQTTRTPARRKQLRSFASTAASYQGRPQRGGVEVSTAGAALGATGQAAPHSDPARPTVKSVSTPESVRHRTDGEPGTALAFRGNRGPRKRMSNSKGGPICPICQHPMALELQPSGMPPRTFQCLNCERPDPMKSPVVTSILKALQPPK